MYVLASKSPRRAELFGLISADFTVVPSENEEIIPDELLSFPDRVVEYLAAEKAKDVFRRRPDDTVIGADTIVVLGDEIMGKPRDEKDAERMLRLLSGKTHFVYTGVCIRSAGVEKFFSEKTVVEFYPLSNAEIARYIATGEPFDKAGAYGIQGVGALLIKGINGDYYNVMGFPVARAARELEKLPAGESGQKTRATPHKACTKAAQSDFSSDCT